MEMEPLISIIVPIYNSEKYIEQCVRSIQTQTYKNIEIILVDDGSQDRGGDICDQLSESDPRIKVYHKSNGGLSDARNYGVLQAKGKYIAFVDSDDYLANTYLGYLWSILSYNDADISCCDLVKTASREYDFLVDQQEHEVYVCSGPESCYMLFSSKATQMTVAWCKLYRSDIVRCYPFAVGRKFEDSPVTCAYLYECDKIVIGNAKLYAYYQNEKGIMATNKDNYEDKIWSLQTRAEFFETKAERKLSQLAWKRAIVFMIQDSLYNNGRSTPYLKKCLGTQWNKGYISCEMKLRSALFLFSPKMYSVCSSVVRKIIKKQG